MFRRLFLLIAGLSCLPNFISAEPESITPEQIISRYLNSVGAEQSRSISTFVERGEVQTKITNPNLANLGSLSSPRSMGQRLRYEQYFKSPNLRFRSTITEENQVMGISGCDGRIAWYIDAALRTHEFNPKPGQDNACQDGLDFTPTELRGSDIKTRLAGQKKVGDRVAWEIKVQTKKSQFTETYYFDVETYLLLRFEQKNRSVTFSDYRDVGGIKRPFAIVSEDSNAKVVTTVREIQLNVPISDSRFVEPKLVDGRVSLNPVLPTPRVESTPAVTAPPSAPGPTERSATEVNYPNFTTCDTAELLKFVPELSQLRPASNQSQLQPLLEKIGARLFDTARSAPNLISHELVSASQSGASDRRQEYDYLILTHVDGSEVVLNEFRVDRNTGEKFETNYVRPDSGAST